MHWVRALAGILVLWSSTAGGDTLTWNVTTESDVAGYHVYHCTHLPCTKTAGTASLLNTLGKVTSFNIGTPSITQFYFITAYDFANHDSGSSNVVTFLPTGSPVVTLAVVGNPATGPWGVQAFTTDLRDVMAKVYLDGAVHHVEHTAPYGFPNDNGKTATTGLFGIGSHTVQFVFYLEGTTTEIGRATVTVLEKT